MIRIRHRRPEDVDVCVPVLRRVHERDGYPVIWPADAASWITPGNLLAGWVAETTGPADGAAGRIIGHVLLCSAEGEPAADMLLERTGRPTGEMAVISRLFVDPQVRGRSAGQALMAAATSYAHQRSWQLVLGVIPDRHGRAVAFYERQGWGRLGAVDLTLSDGCVVPMHCYAEPGVPTSST